MNHLGQQNTEREQQIREEQESEFERANDQLSASRTSLVQEIGGVAGAIAEQDDPEKNLPASATEVQPPEMSGVTSNNDNMETIQQRDEQDND